MKKTEATTQSSTLFKVGLASPFIFVVFIYACVYAAALPNSTFDQMVILVVAAIFGAYMAMNIGANDVANNMGPAVGSGTLTLRNAIIIAAIFELLGAVVAGGDVVTTIKSGIIDPNMIASNEEFVLIMMSALLAGAVWLNLATYIGAPVSTTHSIVGAVVGAGVIAGGVGIVSWGKIGTIVSSWVISPLFGGIIAALLLYTIKRTITYRKDMILAATKVVPILIALMAWAFTTYMLLKGFSNLISITFSTACIVGIAVAAIVYLSVKPSIKRTADLSNNTKESVNSLFALPLIFSAALLSFAHGANDVANAIGPLAAINEVISTGTMSSTAGVPLWVMLIGAVGLAVGLALFGPRLIRTVGSEITDLDKMRAFCIAMASAITVIVASQLGLPISTTHVAIGAVFGVGFLREYLKRSYANMENIIIDAYSGEEKAKIERYLERFNEATLEKKALLLKAMKKKAARQKDDPAFSKKDRKMFKKAYKKELVKRSMVIRIVAAWVITVPATALIAAVVYKMVSEIFWGLM